MPDKFGQTCLYMAVGNDELFSVCVLLKHNVNAHVRDESGRTALDVAICLNRCHFVEELKKVSFVFSS